MSYVYGLNRATSLCQLMAIIINIVGLDEVSVGDFWHRCMLQVLSRWNVVLYDL